MLIPYATDAPIYYFPFATIVMIVVNCAVTLGLMTAMNADADDASAMWVQNLLLEYGHGLRPWQWVTSNFVHEGFMHLLGNMISLWTFGLVVEGKIGWLRFLGIFFGIGILECALEQSMMLLAPEGASCGASSIVFGLMAMAMVWAPKNDVSCVFIFFRVFVFQATLYTVVSILAFVELFFAVLSGVSMSSSFIHLLGAALGFAVAVVMVKRNWVDCEGWDLFTVWKGDEAQPREQEREAAERLVRSAHDKHIATLQSQEFMPGIQPQWKPPGPQQFVPAPDVDIDDLMAPLMGQADPVIPTIDQVRSAIQAGDAVQAFSLYQSYTSDPLVTPPERELLQIINALQKQSAWKASIAPMFLYLNHFRTQEIAVRLRLARILLQSENNAKKAIEVLRPIDAETLSGQDRETYSALVTQLNAMHGTSSQTQSRPRGSA